MGSAIEHRGHTIATQVLGYGKEWRGSFSIVWRDETGKILSQDNPPREAVVCETKDEAELAAVAAGRRFIDERLPPEPDTRAGK